MRPYTQSEIKEFEDNRYLKKITSTTEIKEKTATLEDVLEHLGIFNQRIEHRALDKEVFLKVKLKIKSSIIELKSIPIPIDFESNIFSQLICSNTGNTLALSLKTGKIKQGTRPCPKGLGYVGFFYDEISESTQLSIPLPANMKICVNKLNLFGQTSGWMIASELNENIDVLKLWDICETGLLVYFEFDGTKVEPPAQ